MGVFND
jgi:dual specificity tyrosine-phosphorylation-regulated kinase 2/3/4